LKCVRDFLIMRYINLHFTYLVTSVYATLMSDGDRDKLIKQCI